MSNRCPLFFISLFIEVYLCLKMSDPARLHPFPQLHGWPLRLQSYQHKLKIKKQIGHLQRWGRPMSKAKKRRRWAWRGKGGDTWADRRYRETPSSEQARPWTPYMSSSNAGKATRGGASQNICVWPRRTWVRSLRAVETLKRRSGTGRCSIRNGQTMLAQIRKQQRKCCRQNAGRETRG